MDSTFIKYWTWSTFQADSTFNKYWTWSTFQADSTFNKYWTWSTFLADSTFIKYWTWSTLKALIFKSPMQTLRHGRERKKWTNVSCWKSFFFSLRRWFLFFFNSESKRDIQPFFFLLHFFGVSWPLKCSSVEDRFDWISSRRPSLFVPSFFCGFTEFLALGNHRWIRRFHWPFWPSFVFGAGSDRWLANTFFFFFFFFFVVFFFKFDVKSLEQVFFLFFWGAFYGPTVPRVANRCAHRTLKPENSDLTMKIVEK